MTSEEIKQANPLVPYLRGIGVELRGNGKSLTANRCAQKQHGKGHQCMTIETEKSVWFCNDCQVGGDVIRWMALASGKTDADVLRELGANGNSPVKQVVEKTYNYNDENGLLLFQVVRYKPKTFRQRHKDAAGRTVWGMDGVRRVLYNLPKILESEEVCIVEGEKDADSLNGIGFTATCNVGGAGKWLDTYTETVSDKDVILMPDNDEAGLKHRDLVLASIVGKARTIRIVLMPPPHKDVSDFLATNPKEKLIELIASTKTWRPGSNVPIKTMAEMEDDYRAHIKALSQSCLGFTSWMPTMARAIRSVIPGELVVFLSDTGVGKTLWAANLILNVAPEPCLIFEMELPDAMMFERFVAMETAMPPREVEAIYRNGETAPWKQSEALKHFSLCGLSGLSVEQIQDIVQRSEIRMGCKPSIVLVDYVGLVKGIGRSRYEQTSFAIEQLKVMAKVTGTIVVVMCQRHRKEGEDGTSEVGLHDCKDSGSVENSGQVVLGAWRDANEDDLMYIRLLKCNKGGAGKKITCRLDPKSLRIQEVVDDRTLEMQSVQPELGQ